MISEHNTLLDWALITGAHILGCSASMTIGYLLHRHSGGVALAAVLYVLCAASLREWMR